ncbi:hypothetical protein [Streptomyces fragilis]|uniref:Secreted protein n=1 Tax=Streptomyces fragilis TaxID=67301 RepID=A0ABV2YJX7_9ACTN|nr:hypothetical protein [Streptomyces fragilis]
MRAFTRSTSVITTALAAVFFTVGAAPSSAQTQPLVSAKASSQTKAFAEDNAELVSAMATVCGSGYSLTAADPMPLGVDPGMRLGTLFNYENSGSTSACAILDNNTGATRYMVLESCPSTGPEHSDFCDVDKGDFSQYAGPTYTSTQGINGRCWSHFTYMKNRTTGVTVFNSGMTYGWICP